MSEKSCGNCGHGKSMACFTCSQLQNWIPRLENRGKMTKKGDPIMSERMIELKGNIKQCFRCVIGEKTALVSVEIPESVILAKADEIGGMEKKQAEERGDYILAEHEKKQEQPSEFEGLKINIPNDMDKCGDSYNGIVKWNKLLDLLDKELSAVTKQTTSTVPILAIGQKK